MLEILTSIVSSSSKEISLKAVNVADCVLISDGISIPAPKAILSTVLELKLETYITPFTIFNSIGKLSKSLPSLSNGEILPT